MCVEGWIFILEAKLSIRILQYYMLECAQLQYINSLILKKSVIWLLNDILTLPNITKSSCIAGCCTRPKFLGCIHQLRKCVERRRRAGAVFLQIIIGVEGPLQIIMGMERQAENKAHNSWAWALVRSIEFTSNVQWDYSEKSLTKCFLIHEREEKSL